VCKAHAEGAYLLSQLAASVKDIDQHNNTSTASQTHGPSAATAQFETACDRLLQVLTSPSAPS
jgi:hypothetical protein